MSRIAPSSPRLIPASLLAAGLLACQGDVDPVPFLRGQAIPLGPWVLKVRHPEVLAPGLIKGFQDFRIPNRQSKVVGVHLDLQPADAAAAGDRQLVEKGFLKLMADCRLKDREGNLTTLGLPLPESQFRLLKTGGMMTDREMKDMLLSPPPSPGMPREWVLLYAVPPERAGFTLLIRNRSPRDGQPYLVSVDLGR
jgi:hypothetical protein